MNWFKKWFTFAGRIFKRAAKTTIGQMVDKILPAVLPLVKSLEADKFKSGSQKLECVINAVKATHSDISSVAINLAVNLALAVIREGMESTKR